jgi:hypothetical protein
MKQYQVVAMLPHLNDNERRMSFQRRDKVVMKGTQRYMKHEVNKTRKTVTVNELSCQCGNITADFYY